MSEVGKWASGQVGKFGFCIEIKKIAAKQKTAKIFA